MRRILLGLLLLCSQIGSVSALSAEELPSAFDIKEQKCSKGGCSDLMASGQKIGSLRRTPGTSGTFDFFDGHNQLQVILKFTTLVWGSPKFNVYDKNRVLVGKLQLTHNDGRILRFDLFSFDEKVLLVTGVSNLFGTRHTIYVGNTWDVIAKLSRPLFTWSRDSVVDVVNKQQFLYRVDPNVLAAVMALYNMHNTILQVDDAEQIAPPKLFQDLQVKLKKLADERAIDSEGTVVTVTEAQIKAAADLLNQRYQEIYDDSNLSEEEKIKQFVAFGCGLIQSRTLSPVEEQAMLQFLISRLAS